MLLSIVLVLFAVLLVGFLYAKKVYGIREKVWISKDESQFADPALENARIAFPSLFAEPSVYLSVIVPAYNEEERLPIMMDEAMDILEKRSREEKNFTYEVIVVDDGSKDKTTEVALRYSKQYTSNKVRVLTLFKNRGKGGAVKRGMLCGRGQYLLMVDADGATKFADLMRLEKSTKKAEKNGLGFGIGSRAHLVSETVAKRSPFRNFLMYGFHVYLYTMGVRSIKDTQCGFKLFTRKAAQMLFPNQHIERWAFDVELIFLAETQNIPMAEEAVNWTEIPGSKLDPVGASIQIAKDVLRIRLFYFSRIWTIDGASDSLQ